MKRKLPLRNLTKMTEEMGGYEREDLSNKNLFGPQRTSTTAQEELIVELLKIVHRHPEQRVLQILMNALKGNGRPKMDPYYVWDESLLNYLKETYGNENE